MFNAKSSKTMAIVVSIFFVLGVLLCNVANAEDPFAFSPDAAEQYKKAWNDYYVTQNMDLCGEYSLKEGSHVFQRYEITFNSDGKEKQYDTDIIPSNAGILVTYDPVQYCFGFSIFAVDMKSDLEKVVIYSDNKVINNASVASSHDGQDTWTVTLDGNDIYDLYTQDAITVKLTVDGKSEILDISKQDHQWLYDMAMYLIRASWYSDSNYPGYMGSEYLPDGYKAINTILDDKNTKYSFREDYDAIEKAIQSMFYVEVYDEKNEKIGTASGFVSFDEHLFVTNQHVIEGASYLKIWDEEDNMYVLDRVVVSDKTYDVAILLFPDGMKYDSLGQSTNDLKRGQPVVAIGSPRGFQGTVSDGIISGFQKMPDYGNLRLITINAAVSPGSSGGALFDDSGKVIGITSAGMNESQNLNFAVPVQAVQDLYGSWDKDYTEKLGTKRSWNTAAFAMLKVIEVTVGGKSRVGTYDGESDNGVPNGQGVFQSEDELPSLRYEGKWALGKTVGGGSMIDEGYTIHFEPKKDKAYDRTGTFIGKVQDGIPKGKGSFTAQNSTGIKWVYAGEFENGTFNGYGTIVWDEKDAISQVGHYTNGLYTPTWPEAMKYQANIDECELYKDSEDFLKKNEKIFTTETEISSSLVNIQWDASQFEKSPKSYSKQLINQADLIVIQNDLTEDYENDISFLILVNGEGTLFYGYMDGKCDFEQGATIESLYLLPLNNITYQNVNNEDRQAVYCAFAKPGNKEKTPAKRNTLDLPTIQFAKFNDELSVNFEIQNEKNGVAVASVEISIYATDKDGTDLYSGKKYIITYDHEIKPGWIVKTGAVKIPKRSRIYYIFAGISKITFTDGTVLDISNVNYWTYQYGN